MAEKVTDGPSPTTIIQVSENFDTGQTSDLSNPIATGISTNQATFKGPVTLYTGCSFASQDEDNLSKKKSKLTIWLGVDNPIESFCGRDEFLDQLHTTIQSGRTRTITASSNKGHDHGAANLTVISQVQIISGLGGVGKTETARMYLHRYGHHYDNVVWINAENTSTMTDGFLLTAEKMEIPLTTGHDGKPRAMKPILSDIYTQLGDTVSLIVFDNAEDYYSSKMEDNGIQPFLPPSLPRHLQPPCVLATSRNQDWGPSIKMIVLDVFCEAESILFILKQLGLQNEEKEALRLATMLGHLPLALQQAVAYIREQDKKSRLMTSTPFTIQDYILEFERENLRKKLMQFPPLEQQKHQSSSKMTTTTVYTTWNVTLNKIQMEAGVGMAAVKIIQILSLLNGENVPTPILLFTAGIEGVESPHAVIEGIIFLQKYGMIKHHSDPQKKPANPDANDAKNSVQYTNYISIHRQVQHVIRETLKEEGKLFEVVKSVVDPFKKFLDQVNSSDPTYKTVLTNMLSFVHQMTGGKEEEEERGWLEEFLQFKEKLVACYSECGNYGQALILIEQVCQVRSEIFGPEDPMTLAAKNCMARVLHDQGNLEEALALYRQVYKSRNKILGREHHDTVSSLALIAYLLDDQGHSLDALKIYEQVDDIQMKTLGPDHVNTLKNRNNLGLVLNDLGRYDEAFDLTQKLYDVRLQSLGPEHVHTLTSLHNLALILRNKGEYSKALKLFRQVCDVRTKVLGSDHPHTLSSMRMLAFLLNNVGQFEEALTLQEELLRISSQVLGKEHLQTIETRHDAALVLRHMGRYDESLALHQQVYQTRLKVLGPDHPATMTSLEGVATALAEQARYAEAVELYQNLVQNWSKIMSPDHPRVLTCHRSIAAIYQEQGRLDEALSICQRVYEEQTKILGSHHQRTVETQRWLGDMMRCAGRLDDAFTLLEKVPEACQNVFGSHHHPQFFQANVSLALVWKAENKFEKALATLLETFETLLVNQKLENRLTFQAGHQAALILYHLGRNDEALLLAQRVLDGQKKILREDHPDCLSSMSHIDILMQIKGVQGGQDADAAAGDEADNL